MSKNIDWDNLGFGYVETDYRYLTTYKDGKWDEGGLITDANVTLNECAGVFQYAQTVFEGLKAYYTKDGHIVCFRPDLNAVRLNQSCERLVMPTLPEGRFLEAVKEVVKANKDFVPPYGHGASLYIRPYMMGTNSVIGVKPADEYQFRVFTTPVGPYFKGGANFIFITKDGKLVTPKSDSILPSITRRSLMYVAEHYLGMTVENRPVHKDELKDFAEMGLCGTAAVISPVGQIDTPEGTINVPAGMDDMGPITKKLYDTLLGIQHGEIEAPEGWVVKIC